MASLEHELPSERNGSGSSSAGSWLSQVTVKYGEGGQEGDDNAASDQHRSSSSHSSAKMDR